MSKHILWRRPGNLTSSNPGTRSGCIAIALLLVAANTGQASPAAQTQPATELLGQAIQRWASVIEPGLSPQIFHADWKVTCAEGAPGKLAGAKGELSILPPSRLQAIFRIEGKQYVFGRRDNELWFNEPGRNFALLGRNGVPLFDSDPSELDKTQLGPLSLPISRTQLAAIPLLIRAEWSRQQMIEGRTCDEIRLTPLPAIATIFHLTDLSIDLSIHQDDLLPARVCVQNSNKLKLQVDIDSSVLAEQPDDRNWKLAATADEKVQIVPLAHLARFLTVAPHLFLDKTPTLGPATGERKVLSTEGKGRLETIDGTRVLFLRGSAREMGRQHGTLLRAQINEVVDRLLYGVGVASSFQRGSWFFGDIASAEARLQPFMDPRYVEEIDAIAAASGRKSREARLANFFPELFHCSGFSLFGKATRDGHLYHGRVLDYLRGVGLEQNAVVIVHQPDYGHAWVNLGYAGFIGTVTAMNEKGISIGEMGGGGWGKWDGKPMAELLREVMEKADTLNAAVSILRAGPRTCQYYYVISDGKTKQAVGVQATPEQLLLIHPGEFHPLLPHPMQDTIVMSAGRRYETLSERVKAAYGSFDADSAKTLMSPPVCMGSNIQSVLFEPDTLDFWVANADSTHVASEARFTHYNLAQLLRESASW